MTNPEVSPETSTQLWGIRASRAAWYDRFEASLRWWAAQPRFEYRPAAEALLALIRDRPHWMYHPVMAVWLTRAADADARQFLQSCMWAALNGGGTDLRVRVDRTFPVWTPAGGQLVRPGSYLMTELVMDEVPVDIAVDAWCLCSTSHADAWSRNAPYSEEEIERFTESIVNVCSALADLRESMTDCFDWVLHATRVIVPQVQSAPGRLRSVSKPDQIGIVFLDTPSILGVCEALIHETAHQHFFLTEMNAALIADEEAMFYSPLRKCLRPVRGVFLAYHALVFMAAFYRDAAALWCDDYERFGSEAATVERDLATARSSMASAREHLSGAGQDLLDSLQSFPS